MKWLRMSGLVLLLPHGYEGPGAGALVARVSSGSCSFAPTTTCRSRTSRRPRITSTSLRRQMQRNFRKPLVVMTPKSLLRHKRAVSKLTEFGPGSSFHRVLWDDARSRAPARRLTLAPDEQIKRVVLCSRQGLLRPVRGAREARREPHPDPAPRTDLSVPGTRADRRADAVSERRDHLVPGRAEEPGRLDIRRAPHRELHGAAGPQGIAALRGPQGRRVAGRRPGERASGRARKRS